MTCGQLGSFTVSKTVLYLKYAWWHLRRFKFNCSTAVARNRFKSQLHDESRPLSGIKVERVKGPLFTCETGTFRVFIHARSSDGWRPLVVVVVAVGESDEKIDVWHLLLFIDYTRLFMILVKPGSRSSSRLGTLGGSTDDHFEWLLGEIFPRFPVQAKKFDWI